MIHLNDDELINLVKSVFSLGEGDKRLGILVDIPRETKQDNDPWFLRRRIASHWADTLQRMRQALNLDEVNLIAYPDVGSNNADLPDIAYVVPAATPFDRASELTQHPAFPFESLFAQHQLFMAPTEYSTTAPLKNAAKRFDFRAATMPGFAAEMIPALRIDYREVNRRCLLLKSWLDPAHGASVTFEVDDQICHSIFFDLRYRSAHVSSGRFPTNGVAGNLPSGETYIVPYEGEAGVSSQTEGQLPVQIDDSLLIFTINENRAIAVEGEGPALSIERDHLVRVPAYGNMAELGFGVLGDFGLTPINEILLDEKLGFHVAFGRSDHFGGQVAPKHFPSPAEVIHLDRIYIPSLQPRIRIKELILHYPNNEYKTIMSEGEYLPFA